MLIAAGPEFCATAASAQHAARAGSFPACPTGSVIDGALLRPRSPNPGERHPVTRDLPGSERRSARAGASGCAWSASDAQHGLDASCRARTTAAPRAQPRGRGPRRALLSDHAWLWARGYQDGGPHLDLLRRLAHWLMKEPDLEEEALRASAHRPRHPHRAPDHGRNRPIRRPSRRRAALRAASP